MQKVVDIRERTKSRMEPLMSTSRRLYNPRKVEANLNNIYNLRSYHRENAEWAYLLRS